MSCTPSTTGVMDSGLTRTACAASRPGMTSSDVSCELDGFIFVISKSLRRSKTSVILWRARPRAPGDDIVRVDGASGDAAGGIDAARAIDAVRGSNAAQTKRPGHARPFQSNDVAACCSKTAAAQLSTLRAAMKASCGISTLPNCRIFFLPSFCFSRSLRLRLMSPP